MEKAVIKCDNLLHVKQLAKIKGGQDGAIWNNYLFRFDAVGTCFVYDLRALESGNSEASDLKEICTFLLDKADELAPHSNSVMFGSEYYSSEDEIPLLYTNIYNNYANTKNSLKGMCCVYRVQRDGKTFSSTLVQLIEIGFTEDSDYWKSIDVDDIRPYGNFTIDVENQIYYAFTMRDESNTTRYFAFDLPKAADGIIDEKFNVKRVVLNTTDIKEYFDCEYHHFIQGACFRHGRIYSLEGFSGSEDNPPALRIIDTTKKRQILYADLENVGLSIEPELIDFRDEVCYYGDAHGNLYVIEF